MGALTVGLVGAGPWASLVHAPLLAAGPETRLGAVWSRTAASAEALAAAHGARAASRYEDLVETCEAVAFAVPPAVQAALAPPAARAGRAVLLEKPLADDLAGAEAVAGAVAGAGVGSMVMLTYRFSSTVAAFLDAAAGFDALGGRACFISGAFLGGPFAGGWRLERGALLDVGPHVVDLVDAALGPVTSVRAAGDPLGWVALVLEHEGGAVSDVSICCRAAIEPSRTEVELFGPSGSLTVDARAGMGPESFAGVRRAFAAAAADPSPHAVDAQRGLHLQRVLAEAESQLRSQR